MAERTQNPNGCFGTVIYMIDEKALWSRRGGESKPHILLTSDYETSQLAVPGGKMKTGETPAATMNREFREETGLDITFDDNNLMHTWRSKQSNRYVYLFLKVIRLENMQELNRIRSEPREFFYGESGGSNFLPIVIKRRQPRGYISFPQNIFPLASGSAKRSARPKSLEFHLNAVAITIFSQYAIRLLKDTNDANEEEQEFAAGTLIDADYAHLLQEFSMTTIKNPDFIHA
jgi:8-oxo-dGTP pyrophosphatase MutT (NUDIX family)